MQNHLMGLARTWCDNLTTYPYNWEEWKTLIRIFPDHVFASTLKQLLDRVKQSNETMIQYHFGKLDLPQVCNINDKEANSCLLDGLVDHTLKKKWCQGRVAEYGVSVAVYGSFHRLQADASLLLLSWRQELILD
jgi:hypothetical protein